MRALSWIAVAGICLAVAAALAWYKYDQISQAQARAAAFPEPMEAVEAFTVTQAEREPTIRVTGEVVPARSADLRTEMSGRISSVGFASGARVNEGQVLVQLDVAEERAQLLEARAQEDIARLAFERAERLVKRGAGSLEARDQTRAEFDAARARTQALQASISKKTLTAPFDAVAGLHRLETGQYLNAGDVVTHLVGVNEPLWVDFSVPQEFAGLTAGTEVKVEVEGVHLPAEIIARDSAISTISRNLRLRAKVLEPTSNMVAGMFVQVSVPLGIAETVTLVPATAVRRDALGAAVYVLEAQGNEVRARKRSVTLMTDGDMPDSNDLVVITRGLTPGERIAATGAFKLRDGSLVHPLAANPDAANRLVGH